MILAALFAVATADLRLELVRESLTGTHCRFRQYVDGLPTDEYIVRPCEDLQATSLRTLEAEGAVATLRHIGGRIARRTIVEERPLQPWAYDYDAETGALLRRIPLYFHARPARVFDPNPVVTLNDPSLQDRNDGIEAVPFAAYSDVDLQEVVATGPLRGPYVTMVDNSARTIAPPDASGSLVFPRSAYGFEDVSAYFHIDRSQRYLQSLGFKGSRRIAPYAIEVDAHSAAGADNSFFVPSSIEAGKGSLHFGEGGTDDAEDADLLIHEYAHALHEWIAPGTFNGPFDSEARALAEGIGDYWAYSAHAEARRASGRDPFCFADWDARCWLDSPAERCTYGPGSDCLRRFDSAATMADYEQGEAGVEHRNGSIWASALREIHDAIGKRAADTIVMESLFLAPPSPTFALMARRLLEADRLLYGSAHASAICSAMGVRGVLTDCDRTQRGEFTHFQGSVRGVPIPENNPTGVSSTITITDARAIERIYVRVDVTHPQRGDLRVVLIAPDERQFILHQISNARTPDLHETFGLTAIPINSLDVLRGRSAAGLWTLNVADRRPRDVGTFVSWGLDIQFAGDVPRTTRPREGRAQMIPVVAHGYGSDNTLFASDVRIANPGSSPRSATLVFTRSGEDGLERFAAVQVWVNGGETLAFDDVVDRVFHTAGTGTLEVLGDVVVMSRTYLPNAGGTLGQQVPPNLETTSTGRPVLVLSSVAISLSGRSWRTNLGIAESAGGRGLVRIEGDTEIREIPIEPFSHVQIPMGREDVVRLSVVQGTATVSAYLSQVDNQNGDGLFIPGESLPAIDRTVLAPVVAQGGWTSDVRMFSGTGEWAPIDGTLIANGETEGAVFDPPQLGRNFYWLDVIRTMFRDRFSLAALRFQLRPGILVASRISRGGTSQFVPFLEAGGPIEQQLLFIENSNAFRTNVGFVADGLAVAELSVYDAAGARLERRTLTIAGGVAQTPIVARVVNGRAVVRFLVGTGRAYASLVDNGTSDATFVEGQ